MTALYINQREPGHQFELIATNLITNQMLHVYYFELESVIRAYANMPNEWSTTLIVLHPDKILPRLT